MRWPALVLTLALLPGILPAQEPPKLLSRQRLLETLDVLKGEAADALIPEVRQRGVDFKMTAQDELDFRKAGASERLMAAIREAYRPGTLGPVAGGPAVGKDELLLLLQNGVPATRLEELVTVRGVNFIATPQILQELANAGAGSRLIELVRVRAVPAATAPPPQPPQSQPPPQRQQASQAPAPPQEQQGSPAPDPAWVIFYGMCPAEKLVIFKPTIYANQRELARLACNSFFFAQAEPGTYKFCATQKHCRTTVVQAGASYYFQVAPGPIGYRVDPVSAEQGEQAIRENNLAPLDEKRILSAGFVTVNANQPPASMLTPEDAPATKRKKGKGAMPGLRRNAYPQ